MRELKATGPTFSIRPPRRPRKRMAQRLCSEIVYDEDEFCLLSKVSSATMLSAIKLLTEKQKLAADEQIP